MNKKQPQPNIVFIITDQQRFDTIRALGFDHMDTPNLDRLVNEGTTFTNCHVSAPSCAPSRASLFTGHYPHTTGVLKNADTWQHSWIENLQDSGYHTVNIGKMHSWPMTTPIGFNERYVVENKDRYLEARYFFDEWDKALAARGLVKQQREYYRQLPDYRERLGAFEWKLPPDMHSDMFVGNTAKWWIDSYPATEPLFLQIGFPGPHPPYDPVRSYLEPYLEKDLPMMAVEDEELLAQPPPLQELRRHNVEVDHDSVVHSLNPTPAQRKRQRAHYCANVTMIDEQIGEIIDALDRNDYLDNTVIIFTSDHGDCLTDHGHSQKWTMYDTITRMPMIVWAPGRFAPGRRIDGLCQQMDIGPAILELAGLEPDQTMEARSLLPALKGETWSPRELVYAEHARDGILQGCEYMTMVRSENWKLVHFLGESYGQLFDLQNDPDEVHDRWDDPAHRPTRQHLLDELREWRMRSQLHTQELNRDWR